MDTHHRDQQRGPARSPRPRTESSGVARTGQAAPDGWVARVPAFPREVRRLVSAPTAVRALQRAGGNQAVQRLLAAPLVQRGKVAYYGVDAYKEERKLLSGKTRHLKSSDALNEALGSLGNADLLGLQTHGRFKRDKTAENTVLWRMSGATADGWIEAEPFVKDLLARGLGASIGNAFTLNIVSCFTAGTREQWTEPSLAAKFDLRATFGYRTADLLWRAGFRAGAKIICYIGQSKVTSGWDDVAGQGGGNIPNVRPEDEDKPHVWDADPNSIKPGWDVTFTLSPGGVEVKTGTATATTVYGKRFS
jgi:hypothetical protein